MSMTCETIKIKATDPEQGDYVVINKEDFDKDKHELFEPKSEPSKKELKAAEAKAKAEAEAKATAEVEADADKK